MAARISVTTQRITRAGLNANLTGPTVDGDIIDAGQVFLRVANGSGAPINVTVQTPGNDPASGGARPELIVAVPAAGARDIGPFPASLFAQPADAAAGAGRVLVDYSAITSVTRAVISF
jgi:hypothetical protein